MRTRQRALITVVMLALTAVVAGQGAGPDWPQWRGPNRDGVAASFKEPASWPERLTRKWKVEVGLGYATPIVVGNRVYMFSRQGENESMSGLDAVSGKVLWQTGYPEIGRAHV